jgi:ketosteroid isomerase-like protein
MDNKQIVAKLVESFRTNDIDAIVALYADDTLISVEFDLPDRREIHGAADLERTLRSRPPRRMYADLQVSDLTFTDCVDPDTVIAEWVYTSHIGEEKVINRNLIIVQIKDGKIVRSRDYHNHITRAVADGSVPQIIKTIDGMKLPQDR